MAKKNDIVVVESTSLRRSESVIPQEDLDVVVKISTCKLCNSEFRERAEQEYESKKHNVSTVLRWLKDQGMDISHNAVRNHLHYHYRLQQRKTILSEYAKDVSKWVDNLGDDRIQAMKNRIAILDREAVTLAAESDDSPLEEKRKVAETVKKLMDGIVLLEGKLKEYQYSMKPANIVVEQLQIIVMDQMRNIKTKETRQVLANILEELKDKVGHFMLE